VPATAGESIVELPIAAIERGFYQPREHFDPLAMEATKRSIQEKGQKYPVIVREIRKGNPLFDPAWDGPHYELADGERRFRCCRELGLPTLKALVRDLSDEEMLDYTLTTNDSLPLNPIEKAMVFSRLAKEFNRSQAEIAKSFNLKQQQVSEYIRLLELPKEIQDLTARAVISVRHARELLKISDSEKMVALAEEVKVKALSTRELTKKLKEDKNPPKIVKERIETSDISFEIPTQKSIESSETAMESVKSILTAHIQRENNRTWAEKLHFKLIPGRYYQKMEYWLSFDLGSTQRPETWLIRVELASLCGLGSLLLAHFLPVWVVGAVLGVLAGLVCFLFII
jgi:ParB family chromosome partitioning protein